jgi:hypothetical protein
MYRKEINILRKTVHQVGFIYNIEINCMDPSAWQTAATIAVQPAIV